MDISPSIIEEKLDTFLPRVQRPGRYTGGELNHVITSYSIHYTKLYEGGYQLPLRTSQG